MISSDVLVLLVVLGIMILLVKKVRSSVTVGLVILFIAFMLVVAIPRLITKT